ncbi:MAG: hypothetical protein ACI4JK_05265 [Oscillospiraceae bacterium]
MLTLEDIEKIPREYLIPKEVAQVIGCYAYGITLAARNNPASLGFPVIIIGNRTKIPKQAFLNYMRGEKPKNNNKGGEENGL